MTTIAALPPLATLNGDENLIIERSNRTYRITVIDLARALYALPKPTPGEVDQAVRAWELTLPSSPVGLAVGAYWMNDGVRCRVTTS